MVCNIFRPGETKRDASPLEGSWALSRINIRECVQTQSVERGGRQRRERHILPERREEGRWESERRTEGEGQGTRWEHVSHTEIVNYSFVLRRVGVIWKRDGASITRVGQRWRGYIEGNAGASRRERCDADERARRRIPVSSDPLRPMLVTKVGWAVVEARERRKTRMRLMIYTPATVYTTVSSSFAATILSSFPLFFFSFLSSSSRFLRLGALS